MQEQQSNRNAMKTRLAVMLASVGGAALLLPAGAVEPNYKRPVTDAPADFQSALGEPSRNTVADLQRQPRKVETLNSLIRIALNNSADLCVGSALVEQARAPRQPKPRLTPRTTGDPWDVLAYATGAAASLFWWYRDRFLHSRSPFAARNTRQACPFAE